MTKCEREVIRVCTSSVVFTWCLKKLSNRFYNSIEKVQLSDMGSYQCVVKSEERDVLSQEGNIQLEGEFIFSSVTHTTTTIKRSVLFLNRWKSWDPHSAASILGLPHFSVEPQHMSVVANVSLSLSCVAHGPPEPVRVIWLQDGAPLNSLTDPVALSPSTLNLTGIFFCSLPSAVKAACSQPSQTS